MRELLEQVQRWMTVSDETTALLRRTEDLLERRTELLRSASWEFRDVARLTREFRDRATAAGHEPAARSASPRSR